MRLISTFMRKSKLKKIINEIFTIRIYVIYCLIFMYSQINLKDSHLFVIKLHKNYINIQ